MKPSDPTPVSPENFLKAWIAECTAIESSLLKDWDNRPAYTATVMRNHPPGSIVEKLGGRLGLGFYCGYYHIDAVFFCPTHDKVKEGPPAHEIWLQNIRIAFEHEHDFRSGLYKEVSHLLITRCELRVLVAYPGKNDNVEAELQKLKSIILASSIANEASFLLILGTIGNRSGSEVIQWDGHAFRGSEWQKIPHASSTTPSR